MTVDRIRNLKILTGHRAQRTGKENDDGQHNRLHCHDQQRARPRARLHPPRLPRGLPPADAAPRLLDAAPWPVLRPAARDGGHVRANWSAVRFEHIDDDSGAMLSVYWVDDCWRWKVSGVGMHSSGSGTETTSGAAKTAARRALAVHMKAHRDREVP